MDGQVEATAQIKAGTCWCFEKVPNNIFSSQHIVKGQKHAILWRRPTYETKQHFLIIHGKPL